jgi:hypothetical protein
MVVDCVTSAALPCFASVEENIKIQLLYDVYLGLWFDCQLTVGGVPVVNNLTGGKSIAQPLFVQRLQRSTG